MSTGVFLHLVPPRFTFLVGGWSSSMALLLPGRLPPSLPLAITGAFSLSLLAFPLFLRCYSSLYCPLLRLWCRSTCLHTLLLFGVSCSFFTWVPGCFVPSAPCCLSAVLLSSWGSRLLRSRLPPSSWFLLEFVSCAPPCLSLAISFLQFFFLGSPSRRFGVCLPWLLSLPFQCTTISFSVYRRLVGLPGFPCSASTSLVYLPLSFLQFVTSFLSLGALLTRSHLRYTTRRGLPLGRVSYWFSLLALLVHWSSHALRSFLYVSILLLLFRSFSSRWSIGVPIPHGSPLLLVALLLLTPRSCAGFLGD